MTKLKIYSFIFAAMVILLTSGCKGNEKSGAVQKENTVARKMLQGIWINEDDESPVFYVKGDTLYYPDETSEPAHFYIINDTLIMTGGTASKYQILKQTEHLFVFRNNGGDEVRLAKTTDATYKYMFMHRKAATVNQNKLVKTDSVVVYDGERYHGYVQVNPTTYKVLKTSYNDEGVEVATVYYDNIVHLSVFNGGRQLFSRDFRKSDFANYVPEQYLNQSVLSDIVLGKVGSEGLTYEASLVMPDDGTCYIVNIKIGFDGKMSMAVE